MKRQHRFLPRPSPIHPPALAFCSVAACIVALGCQSESDRDLGWTPNAKIEQLQSNAAQSTEPFLAPREDFVGRWRGIAEDPLALGGPQSAYTFPSGETAIVLDLTLDAGGIGGTVTFGDQAPPAPPTDADKGYPEGASYASRLAYMTGSAFNASYYLGPLPPLEGFSYRLGEISSAWTKPSFPNVDPGVPTGLADGVLSMAYGPQEYLEPWCEMQEPVVYHNNSKADYSCLEGGPSFTDDGKCSVAIDNSAIVYGSFGPGELEALSPEERAAVNAQIHVISEHEADCDKIFLCLTSHCACDAFSCRANGPTSAALTLRRVGDGLVGVLGDGAVFENPRHLLAPIGVVHFVREE